MQDADIDKLVLEYCKKRGWVQEIFVLSWLMTLRNLMTLLRPCCAMVQLCKN